MRLAKYFFLVTFFQASTHLFAVSTINNEDSLQTSTVIKALLEEGHQNKMFPGMSVALFEKDSTQYFNYGYAKMDPQVAVSAQTKFQLGSIGKLMTAIAVLQQVDVGKLDLHADITEYIRDLGLEFKFEEPVTLHCLLTHSCGFNDVNIGYMAKDAEHVLPLEEFIKQFNPGLFQAPGTDIVYSNYSYALAGLIVQKVTNKEFSTYVEENIFEPLAMKNSTLQFPYGYQANSGYANGYKKTKEGFEEDVLYPRHAIPAGSLISNAEDMGMFIKALYYQDTNLLSAHAWELFYTQQFTNSPLLNGYAYGLEQQNINGLNSWAKGGMLPGTLSHILIVPGELAIFSVVNTNDDTFGESFYKSLFDTFYPNVTELKKTNKSISTKKYVGNYRDKRYNRNTEENVVSLFRGSFSVYNNETNDTLLAYHNGQWHSYIPVNKGVFQNVDLPSEYFVFKEDKQGNIVTLYRNLNIGGLSIASGFDKTKWYNNGEFINEYYGFVPIFVFTGLFFMMASLFIRFVRIWKKDFFRAKELPARFHVLFSLIITLVLVHTFFGPMFLFNNIGDFLFGYPSVFKFSTFIGYLLIPLTIGLGVLIWQIWQGKSGSLFSRIYLTLVEVALVIHLGYLYYWSFL